MQKLMAMSMLGLLVTAPIQADARHTYMVDTGSLDDDPVASIPIPILFGVDYEDITPDFGDPRGGGTRTHEGQDIRAPKGTPIVSPTEAVVLRTGNGTDSGLYVYTVNPGGEVFRYMHLDSIADLDRGDELDAGDFIGTVGDTGNAPDGVYHLHFEIRDNNEPTDPYPRLTDTFTLKEKVSFLKDIFREIRNDDEYAEFLVATFRDDFVAALNARYNMPEEIEDLLDQQGIVGEQEKRDQLIRTLKTIPRALTLALHEGDQSQLVTLLQLYLILLTDGPERDALKAAGPTGYYGSVTTAAVRSYQEQNGLLETGVYDGSTRESMIDEVHVTLQLN